MQPSKIKFKKKENKYIWKLVNKLNCEAQKPPSQLRFSLPLIVITITSDEPWNTEPHKTDRKSQVMTFSTHRRNLVFPKRSAKMIGSSVKRKRQLAFERQNSCVYEKHSNVWCCSRVLDDLIWHFLTSCSKCTNQCDLLVWAYREQCVHWRGSKCTNHRKTILIGCFLYFMSIFLSLFCDWSILLGRLNNPILAAALGKLKTG